MKKYDCRVEKEDGMTLTELLVALGLVSIVIVGIYALLKIGETNWDTSTQRIEARQEAARAASKLSAELREAKEIDVGEGLLGLADKNEVIFYANADADTEPEKIRYYLDADRLVRTVTQPSNSAPPWTYTGQPSNWVIADFIRNDSANPLFAYYDGTGTLISTLPASSADLKTIVKVQLSLIFDSRDNSIPDPINIDTTVFLRNRPKGP